MVISSKYEQKNNSENIKWKITNMPTNVIYVVKGTVNNKTIKNIGKVSGNTIDIPNINIYGYYIIIITAYSGTNELILKTLKFTIKPQINGFSGNCNNLKRVIDLS